MKNFLHKQKKHKSKIVGYIVLIIIFVFIFPIAINWAYKTPAVIPIFAMDWGTNDALSFYGSLLGAAATIIALTETIKFTRENQKMKGNYR